ncbi:hypothetical protein Q3A80_02000 [Burkholderia sp. SR8]|jgi:hypothetical protein|uniref:hypothetical protein n=1 Tax=Burkholderia sp. SR8 TaxID=3062277 RepID=UPI004063BAC3
MERYASVPVEKRAVSMRVPWRRAAAMAETGAAGTPSAGYVLSRFTYFPRFNLSPK